MDQFLSEVYGQEKIKKELWHLFKDHRVPHTMIFYGDEGLGKTTAALSLAGTLTGASADIGTEILKWEESQSSVPVLTAANEHIWYLRPLGMELKIDQFRFFMNAMSSFDASAHVCIIDEAQTMMPAVANSLLKTLEEPAENLYFILITHDINALLPTIVSRGERFSFFPLSRAEFHQLASSDLKKYHFNESLTEEIVFQLSEGNPGIALELCNETGVSQPDTAMKFWEILTCDNEPFSSLSRWNFKERKEFLQMLRWILYIGRDLMIVFEAPEENLERCFQVLDREKRLAPFWNDNRAAAAIDVLKKAEAACRRYISIKNIWDMVIIELSHIQKGDYTWNR